ncbi:hypothetical protein AB0A74_40400 [Saccharothrix sp. NPDC042600]|uniref:hypothetical protein n=1 Tax=Saccharothrix TaxID=2071 RepID=UPI00340C4371|nr:hypothetical protein GCM10017745_45140 [Saccharothrix mutabilis subsp. capreolus]
MDDSGSGSSSGGSDSSSSHDSGGSSGYDSGRADHDFDRADGYFDQSGQATGYDPYPPQPHYGHQQPPHGHDPHHYSPHHASHHRFSGRRGRGNLVGAPGWVQACVWIGVVVAVGGVGLFFLEVLTAAGSRMDRTGPFGSDPYHSTPSRSDPPDVGPGVTLFFVGFVLVLVGVLGHAGSRGR